MKLKLLDLSRVLAGPVCSMMLGDMGADVIKVERPGQGDETRGWGPPFDPEGQSAYFLAINRNKKSIALDLGAAADRAVVLELISSADVVLDNFLFGSLERLGLDPEELLERNSDLIWCTISGFGPDSDRPGYDFVQAEGWMAVTGADGPMKVGSFATSSWQNAAIAILALLGGGGRCRGKGGASTSHRRRRVRRSSMSRRTSWFRAATQSDGGNAHPNLVPYQLFERGPAVRIALEAMNSGRPARTLGLHDLAEDARCGPTGRVNRSVSYRAWPIG
jgi:crotonobetainyl-CoA:carnitine CoA-transferase CaiB-like acyl-CoA transferase